MTDIIAPAAPLAFGPNAARHLAAAARVRLVPATGFGYTPRGRTGTTTAFSARHVATATGIGAALALAGSSATAVALMLGLAR